MGWAFGYYDGRPVGYGVLATCDRRGCYEEIDRGLAYRCGDFSGEREGCGRFYCAKHLGWAGPRGGCPHRGKRAWGETLACMVGNGSEDAAVVCLFRRGHGDLHAWEVVDGWWLEEAIG